MLKNDVINEEYLNKWIDSIKPSDVQMETQTISAFMMVYGAELEKSTLSDESRVNLMISFACCMIKLAYLSSHIYKIMFKEE